MITIILLYCVSQKEIIKILTPSCSKSNKKLTIPVCWTKCSSLLDMCSKYQKKIIDHYIKYKQLKWHMYGTIFPTFAKCRSHACYTYQDTSPLSDPFLAETSLLLLFPKVTNYTLTSKYRTIIVITTTEQYFSPWPEIVIISINFFSHKQ